MGLKSKFAGLGAALALGLTLVGPAAATPTNVGNVPVNVTVGDNGTDFTVGLLTGTEVSFGNVSIDAAESTSGGVYTTPEQQLDLQISGDTKLLRTTPLLVTMRLDDGTGSGAFLKLGNVPTFEGADQANFQIPGRYLKITQLGNVEQAKWTGGSCATNSWWNGTIGCVPRDAAGTMPIYKVGDPVGLMNVAYSASGGLPCQIASGTMYAWSSTCGTNAFSDTSSKSIVYIRPGSGTVNSTESMMMTLGIPAGVAPGTYSGVLLIDTVANP